MTTAAFAVGLPTCLPRVALAQELGVELARSGGGQDGLHQFDILAQPLIGALSAFSRLSGVIVTIDRTVSAQAIRTKPLAGKLSVSEALDRLLDNTGLSWRVDGSGAVFVSRLGTKSNRNADTVLLPITVTAPKKGNAGLGGQPDWVYDTPGSVSVVTRQSIRKTPLREVSGIFDSVPGASIATEGDEPGLVLGLRGQFDLGRVGISIDGARQNYNRSGHGTGSRVFIDPALLAGATVEKSNMNQIGGAGASAGIVNLRTVNTEDIIDGDQKSGGRIQLSRGTNRHHFIGDVQAAARLSSKVDIAAAISRKLVGDYRAGEHISKFYKKHKTEFWETDFTDLRQTSGLFKLNIRPSEDQSLRLGYVGGDVHYGTGGDQLPHFDKTRTHTLTARHEWNPSSDLVDLTSNLWWTRTENQDFMPRDKDRRGKYGGAYKVTYDTNYRVDTLGGGIANKSKVLSGPLMGGRGILHLDYGAEFFRDKARTRSVATNLAHPLWAKLGHVELEGSTPSGKRDVQGAYATASYDWNHLFALKGGLRLDRYALNGHSSWCETGDLYFQLTEGSNNCYVHGPVSETKDPDPSQFEIPPGTPVEVDMARSKILPSFGVSVNPVRGIQLFADWRENMRAPTIMETLDKGIHVRGFPFPFYPNIHLRPERSRTGEIGVNVKFDNVLRWQDAFRAKLSLYRSKIDDPIRSAIVPQPMAWLPEQEDGQKVEVMSLIEGAYPMDGQAISYVNLRDPSHIHGTELQLSYDAGGYYLGGAVTRLQGIDDSDVRFDCRVLDTPYHSSIPDICGGPDTRQHFLIMSGQFTLFRWKYMLDGGVRRLDGGLIVGLRANFLRPATMRYLNSEGKLVTGSGDARYALFDFYSSWRVTDSVSAGFSVNNIFDERYLRDGMPGVPGPGRTVMLTLNVDF